MKIPIKEIKSGRLFFYDSKTEKHIDIIDITNTSMDLDSEVFEINDPHFRRKLEIEFNLSHVNRKLLYDLLYGEISNNYRKMHGCAVIRQRAYDKNYNNKRKV